MSLASQTGRALACAPPLNPVWQADPASYGKAGVKEDASREQRFDEDEKVESEATTAEKGARSRKRSEARQRTELVALRLLPGERARLQAAAEGRNVSLSELIRSSALKAAGR